MASTRELERTALIPAWDSLNQQWLWTVVDSEDYARVDFPNWRIKWSNLTKSETTQRIPYVWRRKNNTDVAMHRLILGISGNMQADHLDGNTLDNRRSNLRIVSISQNQMNRKPIGGSSRYKGVSWNKRNRKWIAYIKKDQKRIYLGSFINEEDAARAYDRVAVQLFGSFARINFPEKEGYGID